MFLLAGLTLSATQMKPAWVGAKLCGYALTRNKDVAAYDKSSGYYLFTNGACDGAIFNVTLTRDRHLAHDAGLVIPSLGDTDPNPEMKLLSRSLTPLKTSSGGAIGDTRSQIIAEFGKPSREERSGDRNQYWDLDYDWTRKSSDSNWGARFTLKNGKVIEIQFKLRQ